MFFMKYMAANLAEQNDQTRAIKR